MAASDRCAASTSPGRTRLGRLRLQHDHRHAVRHQVVELARDPGALVGDRGPAGLLPVPLQRRVVGDQGCVLAAAVAHPAAQPPGAGEDHPSGDDVVDRGALLQPGDVDGQGAQRHDRHADRRGPRGRPRPQGVDREQDREPDLAQAGVGVALQRGAARTTSSTGSGQRRAQGKGAVTRTTAAAAHTSDRSGVHHTWSCPETKSRATRPRNAHRAVTCHSIPRM